MIKKLLIIAIVTLLTACSSQPTQPVQSAKPEPVAEDDSFSTADKIDPAKMTKIKQGKTLQLVRIMEGGACKNDRQGVVGMFLLYAYPEDIERIKKTSSAQVFAEFEQQITDFSMHAVQQAVNDTDFPDYLFITDQMAIENALASVYSNFKSAVADKIVQFENETTLTIDVDSSVNYLQLLLQGCEIKTEPE